MPTPPDIHPTDRPPASVACAGSYRAGDPVWVYRTGGWRPGHVSFASQRAATVRYHPTDQVGTVTDTVTAAYLTARAEADRPCGGPFGSKGVGS